MAEQIVVDPTTASKAKLLDALGANPKYRGMLLDAVKDSYPHIPIPEVDARRAAAEVVAPFQKEIEGLRTELAMRDAVAETERVRERHGYSQDEWKKVEALAVERKIGDPDAAADLYRFANQTAAPRFTPTPITQPNMKGLWKDPAGWARNEAYAVLNEFAHTGLRGQR